MRRAANSACMRPLSLALVVGGLLLAAGGLTASAAGDDAGQPPSAAVDPNAAVDSGSTGQPAPASPDSSVAQPSPATAPETPPTPQSKPAPVSVQALRASDSASHSVSIVDYSFTPDAITVHTGDSVLWTNIGQDPKGHTVTGGELNSAVLPPGASYSHTFGSSGTFSYTCSIHPEMHGTVTVLAAKSSSGSSGGSGSKPSGGSGSKPSGGSGSQSSSATSAPSTTGAGTESAAVGSPGAAGSSGSLPSTGTDSLGLATAGLLLIGLGVGLRLIGLARAVSRRA